MKRIHCDSSLGGIARGRRSARRSSRSRCRRSTTTPTPISSTLPSYRRSGRRRDQLARPDFRLRANRPRRRHARRRAHLLSWRLAAVSVRQQRQVRQGDRPGRLRRELRAAGARGSAGQHLDRRRRLESDREVRSRRPLSDGARPEAGEHRRPAGTGMPASGAGRRGGARSRRPSAGAAAVVAAADAAAAARRRRHQWRQLQPAVGCHVGSRRQHLRGRRLRHEQPHRQVHQGRQLREDVGPDRIGPGAVQQIRGIASDAAGNIYVADAGNKRIQVFDGNGTFKSQITNIGSPQAICISGGATQYLYQLELERSGKHGRRRDLQGAARAVRSSASSARPARWRRSSAWSTPSTAGRKTISGLARSGTGARRR